MYSVFNKYPAMPCRPAVIALLTSVILLSACTSLAPTQALVAGWLERLPPTDLLLLGEQHDAPDHQAFQREVVLHLAGRGRLAALVMEMAEQGRSTRGLPPDSPPDQVQMALAWQDNAWPWAAYGPVVMAAVRAGVPVLGGNLPQQALRDTMKNIAIDDLLTRDQWQKHQENIAQGHCGLLPAHQLAPMARVQVARDRTLAETATQSAQAGRTVVLVAGSWHVRRDVGIPLHLPDRLSHQVVLAQAGPLPQESPGALGADHLWTTPALPPTDYCAGLRMRLQPRSPGR